LGINGLRGKPKRSFMSKTRHIEPLLWLAAAALALAGWTWWTCASSRLTGALGGRGHPPAPACPTSLEQLLASGPSQLAQHDIALANLLCAAGLPGAENLNREECLATLDRWTESVRSETERHLYRYRANPGEFESSEGYFRMLMMAVVLYEDCGVRYNPARISSRGAIDPNDHFFADSRDLFLHGLLCPSVSPQTPTLSAPRGTCSSLPVLYVAIGRRLGYPLKLATTKAHLFLRWEGGGERFDLEATGRGMNRYDEEHFKHWPFPVSEEEIHADGYLKSLGPAEEVALFLTLRGHCLMEAGRVSDAIASYTRAVRLAPDSRPYRLLLAAAQEAPNGSSAAGRLPAAGAHQPPLKPLPAAVLPPRAPQLSTLNQAADPNPLLRLQPQ
jgi:hypothetical protein